MTDFNKFTSKDYKFKGTVDVFASFPSHLAWPGSQLYAFYTINYFPVQNVPWWSDKPSMIAFKSDMPLLKWKVQRKCW